MKFTDVDRVHILDTARANLERLADFHVTERDVYAADWSLPEPEPEPRKSDTQPFDWWREIDKRIAGSAAAEREHLNELLTHLIVALHEETDAVVGKLQTLNDERSATIVDLTTKLAALTEQLHALRIEHADARTDVTQLRDALADERAKAVDLPNAFARRSVN